MLVVVLRSVPKQALSEGGQDGYLAWAFALKGTSKYGNRPIYCILYFFNSLKALDSREELGGAVTEGPKFCKCKWPGSTLKKPVPKNQSFCLLRVWRVSKSIN